LWTTQLRTADLVRRVAPRSFAGQRLPVLGAVDNFLICCLHIVSDRSEPGRSLIIWRDIIELGRAVDVAEVEARARETGLLGWVRAVVGSLPEDVRPFPVPAARDEITTADTAPDDADIAATSASRGSRRLAIGPHLRGTAGQSSSRSGSGAG